MAIHATQLANTGAERLNGADAYGDPTMRHEIFEEVIAYALVSIALSLTDLSVTTHKFEL
jgi:hypothetical protein